MKSITLILLATSVLFLGACDKKDATSTIDKAKATAAKTAKDAEAKTKETVTKTKEVAAKTVDVVKTGMAAAPSVIAVGKPAPDFTLMDQDGKEHKLSAQKGKIVVLEWTSPSCPYVKRHYDGKKDTMINSAKMGGEDVVWMAVDSSHFVKADESKKWKDEKKLAYPILLDADGAVAKSFNATNTPQMFVIDKEGVLQYKGAIDDDAAGNKKAPLNYVTAAITALKEGKKIAVPETKPYGCSVKFKG